MPKDIGSGMVPMSKSQKNKARRFKSRPPVTHHGMLCCTACGATATTATLDTNHAACDGRCVNFPEHAALRILAERHNLLADGSPAGREWRPGKWQPISDVATRRAERNLEAHCKLAAEKHIKIGIDRKVTFENGLGEPINL